jgi:hypothetical protein
MGYGIDEGEDFADPSQPYIVDLMTADGKIIPKIFKTQINSIPNLKHDWSKIVTEDGKQLQTIGHHFSLSRPLNNEERSKLDRRGVCLSCHQEIPDKDLAVSLLHHISEVSNIEVDKKMHSSILHKILLIGAWTQVLGIFVLVGGIFGFATWFLLKKRKMNKSIYLFFLL